MARLSLFPALLALAWSPTGSAQTPAAPSPRPAIEWFGDLRLRFEADRASHREDGTLRADRDRLRDRARLGLRWHATEVLDVTLRARTGRTDSQQSPHLTVHDFDGGPEDDFSVVLDQYFAHFAAAPLGFWLGRNELPFFTANDSEMLWDKDATVLGGFATWKSTSPSIPLGLQGGVFGLPDGALHIRGTGAAVQARSDNQLGESTALDLAAGLVFLRGADTTTHLLDGNGQRDYDIGVLSLRVTQTLGDGTTPLRARAGVDLIRNFADYAATDPDPISATFRNDRSGTVLSASLGQRGHGEAGDWELRWAYAWIEKLAVDASFAQDDWVRWGSAGQTDSSNLRGHEVGLRYWLAQDLDLHARFYDVESITTPQDGLRFRLDFNWSF